MLTIDHHPLLHIVTKVDICKLRTLNDGCLTEDSIHCQMSPYDRQRWESVNGPRVGKAVFVVNILTCALRMGACMSVFVLF